MNNQSSIVEWLSLSTVSSAALRLAKEFAASHTSAAQSSAALVALAASTIQPSSTDRSLSSACYLRMVSS
jgi:hypothetical protein